ncbi:MAG: hypothetical protein IPP56_05685 [Bacteroidetes bacterium]|nr:hypothetical protein [Bacteroidota bacterium]MBK9673380.1 hypothetical protein [Bacteroidota bacterium]MBK9799235.1 hypothetical protein [Bacteroidota bacterium]MBP6414061.1 hypothetical protein [Bacteroidia bacterium]
MRKTVLKHSLALLMMAVIFSVNTASAQCKNFTMKKCMPGLAPFLHNGQLNSTTLSPGESAEMQMTFYSGQEYRLLICGQEVLGNIAFKVTDLDKKSLFDSREHENASSWDFKMASTQQIVIEVIVPNQKSANDIAQSACVSMLVGYKK